jgi:hypothetical protein
MHTKLCTNICCVRRFLYLLMEDICSYETSFDVNWTIWRFIPGFTWVTISNPILRIHGQISGGVKFTYIYGTVAGRHVTPTGLVPRFDGYCLFCFDRHIARWHRTQPASNRFPFTILINWEYFFLQNNVHFLWPPLWSNGQISWLQIRRPGFDSRHYQIF